MHPEIRLNRIIRELIKRSITIDYVSVRNNKLAYDIVGFTKSGVGTGTLFIEGNEVKLETRYFQIDVIESLSDLVDVAYEWDKKYCSEGGVHRVGDRWIELYKEFGKDVGIFNQKRLYYL